MRPGDHGDDRQAKARAAAAARGVGAGEALERLGREAVGKAVAVVAHPQPDAVAVGLGGQLDRAAAVAQRVVDEIAERLLQPQPVRVELETVRRR